MVGVMASVSTGAMNSVIAKLINLLEAEYKLQKGVRQDINFMRDELSSINTVLQKMAGMEDLDVLIKEWRNQVRELSYDIEDCVDDYAHHRGRDPNEPGRVEEFLITLGMMGDRRHAEPIQQLKARVVAASERRQRYRIDAAVSTFRDAPAVDPLLAALFAGAASLVGIEGPKGDLVRLLTERKVVPPPPRLGALARRLLPRRWLSRGATVQQHSALEASDGSAQQLQLELKVVAIVGPGGVGKTTLANQVYHQIKGQLMFECCAFVSMYRELNMNEILSDILSQVDGRAGTKTWISQLDGHEAWNRQQLIGKLREYLNDRRYLIIIDDLRSVEAWDIIKLAFPENNLGSRIMTTGRDNSIVALPGYTFDVYELGTLNGLHSKSLFFKHIFGSEANMPRQLRDELKEILRECDGLPFKIISIARILGSKQYTRQEWRNVRESMSSILQSHPPINKMLSLTYNCLPHHMKSCLLHLSIFPKRFIIAMDRLVWLWIAEGFICAERGKSLEEVGESYFKELVTKNTINLRNRSHDGRAMDCQVDDIIGSFIISKSVEDNFMTLYSTQECIHVQRDTIRRLSVNYTDSEGTIDLNTMSLSHVRSLVIFGCPEEMPLFSKFRLMRVLDLENSGGLKDKHLKDIMNLFLLKYLGLRKTQVNELPRRIGQLQYLETLDLRDTSITELPESIVQLRKLMRLLVEYVQLPNGIGNMKALQQLSRIGVNKNTTKSIQDLGKLTELRTLGVRWGLPDGFSNIRICRSDFISSLSKLRNLRSLSIDGCDSSSLDFLPDLTVNCPFLQTFYIGQLNIPLEAREEYT